MKNYKEYKGVKYLIVTPTERLKRSKLISEVIGRGDLFGVNDSGYLTIIPGSPTFYAYYRENWYTMPDDYHLAIKELGRWKNIEFFTCSNDSDTHKTHPDWDMVKLQLMEYYQKWGK